MCLDVSDNLFNIRISLRDSRTFVQHKIKEEQKSREEFNNKQGAYPKIDVRRVL